MNLMFAKTHLKDFVIVILREGLFLYVNQLNMNPLNTWWKKVGKMTANMYMMKYNIAIVIGCQSSFRWLQTHVQIVLHMLIT